MVTIFKKLIRGNELDGGGFGLLAALFHAGDGPGEVGDGDDEEAVEKISTCD